MVVLLVQTPLRNYCLNVACLLSQNLPSVKAYYDLLYTYHETNVVLMYYSKQSGFLQRTYYTGQCSGTSYHAYSRASYQCNLVPRPFVLEDLGMTHQRYCMSCGSDSLKLYRDILPDKTQTTQLPHSFRYRSGSG